MKPRGEWQGMMTIARFNWPYYLFALMTLIGAVAGFVLFHHSGLKLACGIVFAGSAYLLFGSLGVSHFVYDRSDLYRMDWLVRALSGAALRHGVFCHCGFDEASSIMRDKLNGVSWRVLDHYDEAQMSEASIRRARAILPPDPGDISCRFDRWPIPDQWADVVIAMLAIHELRTELERSAWFAEARRCLNGGGRLVVVEHVRDTANFLAFGLGFLHFHSVANWRRGWESAGFRSIDGFRITPFVRVFIVEAH